MTDADANGTRRPYKEAKRDLVEHFEREYIQSSLHHHEGNIDVAILFRTHGDKSNRSLLEVCSMSKPAMKGYPAEFKERAVKLAVESDQPIAQTARDLGVNENTLHTWIGKYHWAVRQEKEVHDEHLYEELKRLRKENARLKEERDILKKAAAYFAQQLP